MNNCPICGPTEQRIVRDHNHTTGMVRGPLCDRCNSWVAIYENWSSRRKPRGPKRYRNWVLQHRTKIEAHLKLDTGIPYLSGEKFAVTMEKLAKAGKLNPL